MAPAADSLYETGNDSATEPSSGTGGRQSVQLRTGEPVLDLHYQFHGHRLGDQ